MAQADSNHTTIHQNAPTVASRRRFLSQAAGVAAGGAVLALATIPPASAAATLASPMDGTNASPALRAAARALDDAKERLKAASATYHEIDARLEEWGWQHPAPRRQRAFKKWVEWANKVRDRSGAREALDARTAAQRSFHQAQFAVAAVAPLDLLQLALKASLAVVFEDGLEPGDRQPPIIARAVATDAVRLAGLLS